MKYSLVDGEPGADVTVPPGELNAARLADLNSAANKGIGHSPSPSPAPTISRLVNDIDEPGAGGFLAAHHVPIISPEIGIEMITTVKRLEVVEKVYPLPPTVDVYRLALHLVLRVRAEHQKAFCAGLERALEGE